MPDYLYVAQSESGVVERGRICCAGPGDARDKLAKQGRRLVGIEETKNVAAGRGGYLSRFRQRHLRFVRASDIELMLQQLAVMLGSGLELAPSLRELSVLSPRQQQRQLCTELAEAVEGGTSFATALLESHAFPPVVTQLVRVGEETGELATTLRRAAEFVEQRRQVFGNILSALAYPLIVALAACSVATYLVGWAIPKLAVFLHAMGRKLPRMTESLLDVASFVQIYGPQTMVAIVLLFAGTTLCYVWQPGRYQIDKGILRLPLVGPLMRMAESHQLASSLALMLRSGVFLPEALETAAMLHRNQYLAARVAESRKGLSKGKDLASSLKGPGFGPMLPSMIAVGERTGDLPRALEHVATFYGTLVESRLKRFGRLIEPTIIVVVGGLVGYVYIAFFMALLSAGGNFK